MPDERLAGLLAEPWTTLTTPGGRPASASSSTKRSASSGVSSAGFSTTVLPHTSAGASFQDGIAIGKFQGVIAPTTPDGHPHRHG